MEGLSEFEKMVLKARMATDTEISKYVVNNMFHRDFKRTKASALQLLIFPSLVNMWLISTSHKWTNAVRGSISVSVFILFLTKYTSALNNDIILHSQRSEKIREIVKKSYGINLKYE